MFQSPTWDVMGLPLICWSDQCLRCNGSAFDWLIRSVFFHFYFVQLQIRFLCFLYVRTAKEMPTTPAVDKTRKKGNKTPTGLISLRHQVWRLGRIAFSIANWSRLFADAVPINQILYNFCGHYASGCSHVPLQPSVTNQGYWFHSWTTPAVKLSQHL